MITISALALHASNLTCQRGERTLFEGLNFDLEAGQALVLTGPNGVGKSSLLRILAGLLRARTGEVRIEGTDDKQASLHYLGHEEGLREALSAEENLYFLKALLGSSNTGCEIGAALQAFGVAMIAKLPVSVLSAGQKRRVALAGLLAIGRPIWLLDEPTTALDSEARALVARLFERHCAAGGMIIAATHLPLGLKTLELRLNSVISKPTIVRGAGT